MHETVKVRMLKRTRVGFRVLRAGQTYDVPAADASNVLRAGRATLVPAATPAERAEAVGIRVEALDAMDRAALQEAADHLGLDVQGTGRRGHVTAEDLRAALREALG